MAGLCEGGNEPPGSLKAKLLTQPVAEDATGKKRFLTSWVSAIMENCSKSTDIIRTLTLLKAVAVYKEGHPEIFLCKAPAFVSKE
ncbi:hypothetical protein ANN_20845 [Periplaneta americana]|uniref:Uncharacterized protein n=1 Tax=Periplaneta americana TaxID=6978 RepID=A0ABQ8SEE5_PERAM|nr:hypothetical protein ANN_20845 [Periplaneta americana]